MHYSHPTAVGQSWAPVSRQDSSVTTGKHKYRLRFLRLQRSQATECLVLRGMLARPRAVPGSDGSSTNVELLGVAVG